MSNSFFVVGYQREQNIADNDKDYEWKDAGWTTCTSSCLGGIQETKIICVEAETGAPVPPINCGRAKERPDVIGKFFHQISKTLYLNTNFNCMPESSSLQF